MNYIPAPAKEAGEALSAALWDAVRPPETRGTEDTSRLAAPVVDASGDWWLECDDAYESIMLAQLSEAQIDSIVDKIDRENGGLYAMKPADKEKIKKHLRDNKGKRVDVLDLLGPKGKARARNSITKSTFL